ncbi:glucose 1-dehydrogenase [Aliiglaciecola sp. CAU 1673]|uniref:glucose 1-dehydrogenase n=1 Tax=Aliiglaciecola sp. CAU 1673 TaxID=3032595 RepID=UPI0023DCC032|nr:glucose 1-dehydrogenase [Aliiglaciecola sp. CAU 1673]MDF2176984.1 glucose 1-dehydrogenase [Aliiglaciecola sp. CAU 1673]
MTQPVVLITGAGRGIGAATAKLLAQQGYFVVINYVHDEDSAQKLLADIRSGGGQAMLVRADLGEEAQILAMFAQIDSHCGRLDALVNNAGILMTQSPVVELTNVRLERVFKVNVIGAFLCCREAVKRMSSLSGGQGGAIVNVSSVAARTGSPGEYVDYAASKGAIDSLTRGLALEVAGQGIRVNAVRPGFIHTGIHADGGEPDRVKRLAPRIPLGRGGEPAEVAEAIAWLLSDKASYATGTIIDLAGGI